MSSEYMCECGVFQVIATFSRVSTARCPSCHKAGKWTKATSVVKLGLDTTVMYLFHIDLCIQAYQLYAQSLVWALDPWYDRMGRKLASRRDNLMAGLYQAFERGLPEPPGRLKGPSTTEDPKAKFYVSKELDPIITRYSHIEPGAPCFQYEAGGKYTLFHLRTKWTASVKNVYVAEYTKKASKRPHLVSKVHLGKLPYRGSGSDALYAFEGATGRTKDTPYGNWSLMGYVLWRKEGLARHLHIVFRGSRSASLARSGPKATFKTAGNPDWVTDMNYHHDRMRDVSKKGTVCRGFGRAILTCTPTILKILRHINRKYKEKPNQIFVTGHSLGGALAIMFASSVLCGTFLKDQPTWLQKWDWEDLQLLPLSAPTTGSKDFKAEFESKVKHIHRVKVKGDKVTQVATWSEHVGAKIVLDKVGNLDPHEPMSVRDSLMVEYKKKKKLVGSTQWKTYDPTECVKPMVGFKGSLADVIAKLAPKRNGMTFLHEVFRGGADLPVKDIQFYIKVLQKVISKGSSYRTTILESTAKKRRNALEGFFKPPDTFEEVKELVKSPKLFKGFADAQDDEKRFLSVLYTVMAAKHLHGIGKEQDYLAALLAIPTVKDAFKLQAD